MSDPPHDAQEREGDPGARPGKSAREEGAEATARKSAPATAQGPVRLVKPDAPTLPADPVPSNRHRSSASSPEELARQAFSASRLPVVERDSYAVAGEVAQGGIGRVLRARHKTLNRTVAVKELLHGGDDAEVRFVREALLTARLQHPSIVPIYDAGRWPSGEPFYAMKLVTGRSFDELIAKGKSLADRLALLSHVRAAAEAVAYAHSQRIIHRDLKPANILVGELGETVVIDWGLGKDLVNDGFEAAREPHEPRELREPEIRELEIREHEEARDDGEDGGAPEASSGRARGEHAHGPSSSGGGLTMVGAILGTPAYMPPEQALGKAVDERADVYALGAILYHLLAGEPPYSGPTSLQILKRVKAGPPAPLERQQPGVPEDLQTIVNKAMARDQAARYPTARELAEDLKRFETGQIVGSHRYSARERFRRFARRYRAPIAVTAAALALLVTLGAVSVKSIVEERDRAQAARELAEDAQQEATVRADELTLEQARASLDRDPNESLAWLKSLSPSFTGWRKARLIAADALARGLADVLRGHTGGLNTIAFSPDGTLLATASDDHTVRLWDLERGTSRVLEGHTDEVWFAAFSPDGKLLATSGKDKTLRLWDLATGGSRRLEAPGAEIHLGAFVSTETLATAEYRGIVRLWSVKTGEQRALPSPGAGNVLALRISPDRRRIACFTPGPEARVWALHGGDGGSGGDGGDGGEPMILRGAKPMIDDIAFSPDGKALAMVGSDPTVRIWDLERASVRLLEGHKKPATAVAFSPDGKALASAGSNGEVRVWDLASGSSRALPRYDGRPKRLAFSPDGRLLAAGGGGGTVQIWSLDRGEARAHKGFRDAVTSLTFSPDGSALAAASMDHTARLFHLTAPGDRILGAHDDAAVRVAFSPKGDAVVSASADKTARIWPLSGGAPIVLRGHASKLSSAAFSPDGERVITGSVDGEVRVWDARGALLHTWASEAAASEPGPAPEKLRVEVAPAGRLVAIASNDGIVRVGDVISGELRVVHRHGRGYTPAAFSQDGSKLVSYGADDLLYIWDAATGEGRSFPSDTDGVLALAFSPGARGFASGSDHLLRLWDTATGESRSIDTFAPPLQILFTPDGKTAITRLSTSAGLDLWDVATGAGPRSFRGHSAEAVDLALSPDALTAVTASRDMTARLWDIESGESRVLRGHTDEVLSAAFSKDGAMVATAGKDGAVRIWSDDLPHDPAALRARIAEAAEDTFEIRAHHVE